MNSFRYTILALTLTTIGLGGYKKDSTTMPTTTTVTATQRITTGSWRFDQVKEAGQVTSTGSGIKDQYSLTSRSDSSYTQKTLATGTPYPGTWMLMSNNTMLRLTDNSGGSTKYTLAALSATELRYSFTNKNGMTEERTFSAQP